MLFKKHRLNRDKDFKNLFKVGKRQENIDFRLIFTKNYLDCNRFAFVVDNSVSNKAVKRNLLKRRLRAIIRKSFNDLIQGFDIAILAKPNSINRTFQELEKSLGSLLVTSGLIKQ